MGAANVSTALVEPMMTIEPAPDFSSAGMSVSQPRTVCSISISKLRTQFFSLSMPPPPLTLGMKTSHPPSASTARWSQALYASPSRTFTASPTTVASGRCRAVAASVTSSALRAQKATLAPSASSVSTTPRPMPLVAPVTMAFFPRSPRSMMVSFSTNYSARQEKQTGSTVFLLNGASPCGDRNALEGGRGAARLLRGQTIVDQELCRIHESRLVRGEIHDQVRDVLGTAQPHRALLVHRHCHAELGCGLDHHRRLDGARVDRIAANVVMVHLAMHGDRLRHRAHGPLGGAVGVEHRVPEVGGGRAHVDDRAAP